MKNICVVFIASLLLFGAGCAGARKMYVPLAEIDRSIVDPRGTWAAKPAIAQSIYHGDSMSSKNTALGSGIFPSYSITDNLSIPSIPSPSLVWQITKNPNIDTTARYKWQLAIGGGLTNFSLNQYETKALWKKRLTPSAWYFGKMSNYFLSNDGFHLWLGIISNGLGFQLSPKTSVTTTLSIDYDGTRHYYDIQKYMLTGAFNFHHSFSDWFSFNTGTYMYIRTGDNNPGRGTGIGMYLGGEFYW